ncbi:hypothetical protein LEN26_001929 [Aphanomyces euteiches]|nr:hypothetical protein AeMF1_005324 [Aphanomyces euteiches]KAH9160290.1 hypothetical protein LEN26_001929 [Aphanomyces euteiches]KAH9187042.1 hypothetical protein AeNC1_010983 [Aphanomyces euteiches]
MATEAKTCLVHKHRTQCLVQGCYQGQVRSMKASASHHRHHHRIRSHHRTKRLCIVDGCSKQAHARQKCVRHGGGKLCKVDNCSQHARANGLCYRHRSVSDTPTASPEPKSSSISGPTSLDQIDDAMLDRLLMEMTPLEVQAKMEEPTVVVQEPMVWLEFQDPLVRIANTVAVLNTMQYVSHHLMQN